MRKRISTNMMPIPQPTNPNTIQSICVPPGIMRTTDVRPNWAGSSRSVDKHGNLYLTFCYEPMMPLTPGVGQALLVNFKRNRQFRGISRAMEGGRSDRLDVESFLAALGNRPCGAVRRPESRGSALGHGCCWNAT
jgi:hypothetical protein